jgi:hypothetical protein
MHLFIYILIFKKSEKKYSDFGGGKKNDSEFLSYNLMLKSGKKNCALHHKNKNKCSNSCVDIQITYLS